MEGLGLRDADELGGLRPVADVVPVPVDEEVRGRAVDELETLVRDRLPVGRGDAFAHDPPRDRGELVVDVRDVLRVDALADFLDSLSAPVGVDEALEVGCRHELSSWSGGRCADTKRRKRSALPVTREQPFADERLLVTDCYL